MSMMVPNISGIPIKIDNIEEKIPLPLQIHKRISEISLMILPKDRKIREEFYQVREYFGEYIYNNEIRDRNDITHSK